MAPSDYVPLRKYLTFGLCKKSQCVSVDINDDEMIEDVESFYLTLRRISGLTSLINLHPNRTMIIIKDRVNGKEFNKVSVLDVMVVPSENKVFIGKARIVTGNHNNIYIHLAVHCCMLSLQMYILSNISEIVVGFERNYTVEEDAGILELCVVLSSKACSIDPHIVTINNGKIWDVSCPYSNYSYTMKGTNYSNFFFLF